MNPPENTAYLFKSFEGGRIIPGTEIPVKSLSSETVARQMGLLRTNRALERREVRRIQQQQREDDEAIEAAVQLSVFAIRCVDTLMGSRKNVTPPHQPPHRAEPTPHPHRNIPPGRTGPKSHVSVRLRFSIIKRDNGTCQYCGATDTALHVDHVIPKSRNGSNHPDNLVTACRDCNLGKTNILLTETR